MKRQWMAALATVGLAASILLARPGVVKTRDGQRYEGEVNEKADQVSVTTKSGISLSIARDNVAAVEYPGDLDQQYLEKHAKLGPKDIKGRLELARWAFDNRKYTQARQACDEALEIDPNNAEAAALSDTIFRQIRLEGKSEIPPTPPPQRTAGNSANPRPGTLKTLSEGDINIIRQMELTATDPPMRVRFDHDVKNRYLASNQVAPAQFKAMRPWQQALAILQSSDANLAADVIILDEPPAMREFRRVQQIVLSSCGASGCHGPAAESQFQLLVPADNDAATYTNFYLLEQYMKAKPGAGKAIFGGGALRLIDRAAAEQSLLLQYGLPLNQASTPHPDVRNFRQTYGNKNDRHYQLVLNWIRSLRPNNPNYGIDYQTPTSGPTTQKAK